MDVPIAQIVTHDEDDVRPRRRRDEDIEQEGTEKTEAGKKGLCSLCLLLCKSNAVRRCSENPCPSVVKKRIGEV